jgi:hypothetical protein
VEEAITQRFRVLTELITRPISLAMVSHYRIGIRAERLSAHFHHSNGAAMNECATMLRDAQSKLCMRVIGGTSLPPLRNAFLHK